MRLRCRLNGGGKDARSKLAQHLTSKGVPSDRVNSRVRDVMQVISDDQLSEAYRSLEPWSANKAILGNRVRLVTQDEMRSKKFEGRSSDHTQSSVESDPWDKTDPWLEARKGKEDPGPLAVFILPDFFECDCVIPEIQNEAHGICLLPCEQLATLTSMPSAISSRECTAIVLADSVAETGKFPSERIKFEGQTPYC